ncbi:MAG TPA: ribosomal-processing cysteine protease Prp [Erysipelotrichaceae bacterium]|nr:ribosomal-processing cysteine protease Prp [Erysipelotrichaceae bacterium]
MIKVKIGHASNRQINFLEVKGHANSAEFGKDLVCAAVSAVITGGFNNLHNVNSYDIILEEGQALFKTSAPLDAHDETVIETIVCGLKTIQESNREFIEIKTDD